MSERSTSKPHAMPKQSATTGNKKQVAPIDLTFGFPGKLPTAGKRASNARLLRFFEQYARIGDAREAAQAAGYSVKWAKDRSYKYLKEYSDYVAWMQAHVAYQTAKQIGVDQEQVVQEMSRIAFANEHDYLVFETKGATKGVRRKRLDELTREQMSAIEVNGHGENLHYRMRDRDGNLEKLGKHLGLFNEKIILEHRHRHLRTAFDLSKVPLKALEALEAQFEELLGEGDATK